MKHKAHGEIAQNQVCISLNFKDLCIFGMDPAFLLFYIYTYTYMYLFIYVKEKQHSDIKNRFN